MLTIEAIKEQTQFNEEELQKWIAHEESKINVHHCVCDYLNLALRDIDKLSKEGYVTDYDYGGNAISQGGMIKVYLIKPKSLLKPLKDEAKAKAKKSYRDYLDNLKEDLIEEYLQEQEEMKAKELQKQREQQIADHREDLRKRIKQS